MVALICLDEYEHARHLYRRTGSIMPPSSELFSLWSVTKLLIQGNIPAALKSVSGIIVTNYFSEDMKAALLTSLQRKQVNVMARSFVNIRCDVAAHLLGVCSGDEASAILKEQGWTQRVGENSEVYLEPPTTFKQELPTSGPMVPFADSKNTSALKQMLETISFLEYQKFNSN